MVLQLLIEAGYQTVRHSWVVSTVVVKYVIGAHVARLAYEDRLSFKELGDELIEYSRYMVAGIIATGFISAMLMLEVPVGFKVFSQVVALAYFGFLFWKF